MRRPARAILLIGMIALVPAAQAGPPPLYGPGHYQVDDMATRVHFHVKALVGGYEGDFVAPEGMVVISPDRPDRAAVDIQFPVEKMTTGDASTDAMLKGDSFFRHGAFPHGALHRAGRAACQRRHGNPDPRRIDHAWPDPARDPVHPPRRGDAGRSPWPCRAAFHRNDGGRSQPIWHGFWPAFRVRQGRTGYRRNISSSLTLVWKETALPLPLSPFMGSASCRASRFLPCYDLHALRRGFCAAFRLRAASIRLRAFITVKSYPGSARLRNYRRAPSQEVV